MSNFKKRMARKSQRMDAIECFILYAGSAAVGWMMMCLVAAR